MKNALSALLMVLTSSTAFGGSWDWGCIGTLPYKSLIRFDRGALAIVETTLPPTFSSGVVSNAGVSMYRAIDVNSGFQKEMTFKATDGDDGVKLVELKSKKISSKGSSIPCTDRGARELSDDRTIRVYEVTAPMLAKPVKVKMQCFEAITTTCG